MISKHLLLLISCGLLAFTSCKKGSSPNYPVEGKWQQTKLRIYGESLGVTTYDTTYTNTFTSSDYAQFNADGTATLASDHYYYPNLPIYPEHTQVIPVMIDTFKYTALGSSKFLLQPKVALINYGGGVVADTIEVLNAHSLLLHSVFFFHDPSYLNVSDSYFEK